ncbi:MAG: hypothetical protein AABZ55_00080 [Bdellovibrionota bacterium]
MLWRALKTTVLVSVAFSALLHVYAHETETLPENSPINNSPCDLRRIALKEILVSNPPFELLKKKSVELVKSITPEEDETLTQLVSMRRGASVSEQTLSESYESIVGIYRKAVERNGHKFRSPILEIIPGKSLWFGVTGSAKKGDEMPAIDARISDFKAVEVQDENPLAQAFLGIGLIVTSQTKRLPVQIFLEKGSIRLSDYIEAQLPPECVGIASNLNPIEFNSISKE